MKKTVFISIFIGAIVMLSQSNPVAIAVGTLSLIVWSSALIIVVIQSMQTQSQLEYVSASTERHISPPKVYTPQQRLRNRYRTINSIRNMPLNEKLQMTPKDMPKGNICLQSSSFNFNLNDITQGIIIDKPWIDLILTGKKKWEMRSSSCKKRGPIALIKKGTKKIFGVAYLVDCEGPFNNMDLARTISFHQIPEEIYSAKGFKWRVAWKLNAVNQLSSPIAYEHKVGAVTWVNLDIEAQNKLRNAQLISIV